MYLKIQIFYGLVIGLLYLTIFYSTTAHLGIGLLKSLFSGRMGVK